MIRRLCLVFAAALLLASPALAQITEPPFNPVGTPTDRNPAPMKLRCWDSTVGSYKSCNLSGGGGGGDASSLKQEQQIAQETLTNTRIGDIASPATGTLSLGDCNPIFLASSARNQLLEPGSPFVGGTGAGIGFIGLWNADCGWATTANRRVLMDASGNPVARTPYAAVNGAAPKLELWGSKGDWLYGTPDGSNGPQTMSTDWFAISRMG